MVGRRTTFRFVKRYLPKDGGISGASSPQPTSPPGEMALIAPSAWLKTSEQRAAEEALALGGAAAAVGGGTPIYHPDTSDADRCVPAGLT